MLSFCRMSLKMALNIQKQQETRPCNREQTCRGYFHESFCYYRDVFVFWKNKRFKSFFT